MSQIQKKKDKFTRKFIFYENDQKKKIFISIDKNFYYIIMNHIELAHLKDDVDAFIANNKERYEIIMSFQDQLGHISSDSLTSTISFIKVNHDVFFKDHPSAIFFLYNIFHFSYVNFKQLELIVDIGHSFLSDLKKANVSEDNLIELSMPINFSIINMIF